MSRLPDGGRIDRGRRLGFRFDGRAYAGHPGDTLASALLANGVHLMGRSFKYHRPRGVLSAGAEEPNALVTTGRGGRAVPNQRATCVELFEGLEAVSQNRFPSLAFDLGAVAQVASPLLGAGFYYKTFMGPGAAWHRLYEPLIRRAAGLGAAPGAADPDRYGHRYAHCEVLVVGAGATGLAAALAASESGQRVILADEQAEMGGWLLSEARAEIEGRAASVWCAEALAVLAGRGNVTLLSRTTAFGMFAQNFVGLAERVTDHVAAPAGHLPRERMWKVRAGRVVLATGATERPMVFPGNDRPGVMLAGAAQSYANRWAVKPGTRAVVLAADDSGHAAAMDLAQAGVEIAAIVDIRPEGAGVPGIRTRFGHAVSGTIGRLRVAAADIGPIGGERERVSCDLVLMAGGWTPSLHLFSQARGKLRFDAGRQLFLPGEAPPGLRAAGGCAGRLGLAACIADGFEAGEGPRAVAVTGEVVPAGGHHGQVPGTSAAGAFVDFQNDVKAGDIGQAVAEGFRSIEHLKRYTTTGMATDQGKTSNMNALAIAAAALERPIPAVGLTTFRMPYTPVTFGVFAGHSRGALFDPVRRTPMHAQAVAAGAVFEDVGQWKRAHYFPRAGEGLHEAVARECLAVRRGVGVFDASTLGKIEIVGPDAAEFLNRLYTNAWTKMAAGTCRYGLMLSEAGFVWDDGVVARLAADRFYATTTTGGAAAVLAHMEDYAQTEWPDLRVWLTSITEQWAVIAVQGPRAREVIAPLVEGIDLAMPHMGVREGLVCGVPARLFRVSFTGELGFEINVPADQGAVVWDAVAAAGAVPYGTEAMHVLRAEKGYIITGQETDGTVTPGDLGLGWAIGKSKPDFIGKRSLVRPDMLLADRKQLVGLLTADPAVVLEEGAQITEPGSMRPLGHVTSAYHSAVLGRSIALALVAGGRGRMGGRLAVPMPGGEIAVEVSRPVFYDPEGVRLDG